MKIDYKTYSLDDKNYIKEETDKKIIVFGDTFNTGMSHYFGWKHRLNGSYKKTAHFTITKDGKIYNHFKSSYKSNYLDYNDWNNKSIVVLLENFNWLVKDEEKNKFITWFNDIYNTTTQVFEKRWRSYFHWEQYTEEQLQSSIDLVKKLCAEHNIPKNVIAHNTKVENLSDFEGILCKGNIDKHFTDLNPSWDFSEFKNKIEL